MNQEYKALLAGVPLMSATDQDAFFGAVKQMYDDMVVASLERLQAGVGTASVDKRVARYVALRDARASTNGAADRVDKAYKNALDVIEKSLIATAQSQGVTGFKTEHGTTYLEEQMHASIADDTAFYGFVRDTGDLDFFERRIKIGHIKEYAEANEGRMPPGLNIFRELAMKVRRK